MTAVNVGTLTGELEQSLGVPFCLMNTGCNRRK